MNTLRKDSFTCRLTSAQLDELFNDLAGGLSLDAAAEKAMAWSVPKRRSPPSLSSVCRWYKQRKAAKWMSEQADTGPEDAEMEERARRGLLRARYYCVSEGLEPREVAAFERNEIWRQRLELDERKHEHAMLVDDMAKRLEEIEEQVAEMQENLDEMLEEVGADRAKRKAAFDSQVEINMVLIQLARMKTGNPYWVPDKGPDGRRHEAVPGQAPVPIETVERAVELMMRADIVEMQQAAEEAAAAAAAEKAEGLKGGRAEGNGRKEAQEGAAAAAEAPSSKPQAPGKIQLENKKPEGAAANGAKGGEGVGAAAEHRTLNAEHSTSKAEDGTSKAGEEAPAKRGMGELGGVEG